MKFYWGLVITYLAIIECAWSLFRWEVLSVRKQCHCFSSRTHAVRIHLELYSKKIASMRDELSTPTADSQIATTLLDSNLLIFFQQILFESLWSARYQFDFWGYNSGQKRASWGLQSSGGRQRINKETSTKGDECCENIYIYVLSKYIYMCQKIYIDKIYRQNIYIYICPCLLERLGEKHHRSARPLGSLLVLLGLLRDGICAKAWRKGRKQQEGPSRRKEEKIWRSQDKDEGIPGQKRKPVC